MNGAPIMRGQYYPRRSVTWMPLQDSTLSDRLAGTGMESESVGRIRLAGYPCAVGCGHYCNVALKI